MIEITSVLRDSSLSIRAIYEAIAQHGWEVAKVEIKNNAFEARLKAPHGEIIRTKGSNEADALTKALAQILRVQHIRTPAQARVGMLEPQWLGKLVPIAQAYQKAPMYDSKAAPAFQELGDDSIARANVLRDYIKIEETDDPEPYESAQDMHNDLQKSRHLYVTRHNLDHPLWSNKQQLAFRACHDVLGHGVGGGEWDWHGANRAFAAHAPLLSADAQKALFSETLGRSAFNNHFRTHAPHKISFLTKYMKDLDQHGMGEPPSQLVMPDRPKLKVGADPNQHFAPNLTPAPDNAYLWHRIDNVDPLDAQGLKEYANKLDIGLGDLSAPLQKQAVANALRASILERSGDEKWSAIHYQDLHGIPYDVDDPVHYFKILHDRRNPYNTARNFVAAVSHSAPFESELDLMPLASYLKATLPKLDQKELLRRLEFELFHMICEEEEQILAAAPELSGNELEDAVIKAMQKRIKFITKTSNKKHDYPHYGSSDLVRYKGFRHNDLKQLGKVSRNIDELHDAALTDLEQDGRGHHFRNATNDVGLDPRISSRAWFFLAPKTSDLAPIDHDHKLWVGDGDQMALERKLMGGRDLAGYGHVPLGLFSQAIKDYTNHGPFQHGEINTLSPINPQPYGETKWGQPQNWEWSLPEWWNPTGEEVQSQPTPAFKPIDRVPWYIDPEGAMIQGQSGQSLMSLLNAQGWGSEALGREDLQTGKQ